MVMIVSWFSKVLGWIDYGHSLQPLLVFVSCFCVLFLCLVFVLAVFSMYYWVSVGLCSL